MELYVLANTNNCLIGDNIVSRHTGNIFGQLHNYQTLVRPPFRNLIDAAVSTIDTNHFPYPYSTVRRRPALAIIGSRVSKFGARTGRRWGRIISINAQIIVNYGGTGNLNFMQTIVIRGENGPFSLPGDSGSFVINEHGHVVGLLFSGNGTDLSFANHISHVQTHLGIDF